MRVIAGDAKGKTLKLVPGKGTFAASQLHRWAEQLQSPAEVVLDSAHPGTEPWEQSFLAVEGAGAAVLAVKKPEAVPGLILRLQEMRGRRSAVSVRLGRSRPVWKGTLDPWAIKTLKIAPGRGRAKTVATNLLEQ